VCGSARHAHPLKNVDTLIVSCVLLCRYYLDAAAVLHSALNTGAWGAANITLEGRGVVSGEDLRQQLLNSTSCTEENDSPQGLTVRGALRAVVRGVTFVDFPNHHIIAQVTDDGPCAGQPGVLQVVRWGTSVGVGGGCEARLMVAAVVAVVVVVVLILVAAVVFGRRRRRRCRRRVQSSSSCSVVVVVVAGVVVVVVVIVVVVVVVVTLACSWAR
jgi:hypothetical protein